MVKEHRNTGLLCYQRDEAHCRGRYWLVEVEFASSGRPKDPRMKWNLFLLMDPGKAPAGHYTEYQLVAEVSTPEQGSQLGPSMRRLGH